MNKMSRITRIAITGAAGRMGKTLIALVAQAADLKLTAAIERPASSFIGADAGEVAGIGRLDVAITDDLDRVTDTFDVLIDFTTAAATVQNLEICLKAQRKMVIGTTGLSDNQNARLNEIARHTAIIFAPNYSVGINVTFKLLEIAARIFGDAADIEITEAHHKHKIDAPSGTALKMGQVIADTLGRNLSEVAVYDRQGVTGERDAKAIGFTSIRAGDIIGEHSVMFAAAGERVEIMHRAHSRTNFAEGAIRAATWVTAQQSGLFDMQDVLGLK